eukprot:TRINITY_DN5483_c0_g2_i1.p1 TRINITY_DN5483_c0_g2~~TRINITY_DN5483_c0_g2_i1.p1  ORF type:complete len:379 (-),score=63.39 TRINITY_DN5483_c0_g2_i1:250-1386(-)
MRRPPTSSALTVKDSSSKYVLTLDRYQVALSKVKDIEVVRSFPMIQEGLGKLSLLELWSVLPSTVQDYLKRVVLFCQFCQRSRLGWNNLQDLEEVLLQMFDRMFFHSTPAEDASKLMAALKFVLPMLQEFALARGLPRAHRALQGWKKAVPAQQRLPFPWVCLTAVIGVFLWENHFWESLCLLVLFRTYIRPGTLLAFKVNQLVGAMLTTSAAAGLWTLNLNPVEAGTPGKTGPYDESILWDTELWASTLFLVLTARPSHVDLWPFSANNLRTLFAQTTSKLGMDVLKPCLYSLRNGGASDDVLAARRTKLAVKCRGGWMSDKSLVRYSKEAKLASELLKIPQSTRDFGELVAQHLEVLFLRNLRLPPPCVNLQVASK